MISVELYNSFSEWVRRYIAFYNQPEFSNTSEEWRGFDWEKFNTRGMELSHQLKAELGESFIVKYFQACEETDGQRDTISTLGLESENN